MSLHCIPGMALMHPPEWWIRTSKRQVIDSNAEQCEKLLKESTVAVVKEEKIVMRDARNPEDYGLERKDLRRLLQERRFTLDDDSFRVSKESRWDSMRNLKEVGYS